jgi:ribosomal protein S18 acetylase RimI-like enzyme
MIMDSTVLRDARPIFDEGLVFARYLDEAFEGFIRTILGRRFAEMVATAYVKREHVFSYENTIVAERDQVVIGMICGYTAEQHRRFTLRPLKEAAHGLGLRTVGVSLLGARLRLLGAHTDGDFYIQAFAVQQEFRGQGIGSALMDCIEKRARAGGAGRLSLDVAARNRGARRLYKRHGLTIKAGWRETLRVPRFVVRMTKPLE